MVLSKMKIANQLLQQIAARWAAPAELFVIAVNGERCEQAWQE
jgi:hypothetical protein